MEFTARRVGRIVLALAALAAIAAVRAPDARPVDPPARVTPERPRTRPTPVPTPVPPALVSGVRTPPALLVKISDERPSQPLEVVRADVRVVVVGFLAETTTTLTFRNNEARALEGDLIFPLPEGATVSGYALDVGGELVDGVVVERQQARVAFEQEVRKGVDPGLVEWVQGSNFRTRVWPVPARGTRTVRVSYVSDLVTHGRGPSLEALYELPLRFTSPVAEFSLAVEVVKGAAPEVRAGGPANFRFERFEERYVARTTLRDFQPREDLLVALPGVPRQSAALETAEDGGTYFAIDDFPEPPAAAPAPRPRRVTLFWDASLSRCEADTARERGLVERFLRRVRDVELDVVVFRNEPEPVRTFLVRGGDGAAVLDFLRTAPCDGGTALGALRLPRPSDFALLFSDGLGNLGDKLPPGLDTPLYALSGDARADHALLTHLAERSGGAFFNLQRVSDDEVVAALGAPAFTLLGADYDRRALGDVLPEGQPRVGARFTLAGRLLRDEATLTLRYGRRGAGALVTHTFRLRRADAVPGRLVARAWAQRRVAALSLFPEQNHDELLRLGRAFGLVTPGASLLVLETLEQHLTYGVEPPATRPALRDEYLTRVSLRDSDEKARRAQKLERVVEMWNRRVEWWQREFRHDLKQERAKIAVGGVAGGVVGGVAGGVVGGVAGGRVGTAVGAVADRLAESDERRERDDQPRPAPAAPAQVAGAFGGGAALSSRKDGGIVSKPEATESGAATIVLKPWQPDTPYLATLERAGQAGAYAAYLAERETWGSSPAFYLDCADHFLRAGRRDLALRVLTSVVELQLGEPRLLRVAAHRLQQIGALSPAVELFEEVLRLRPEEPQSLRDLALALEARADAAPRTQAAHDLAVSDYERAVELLKRLTLGAWDGRFPEVEVIALEEANRILTVLARELGVAHPSVELDPRLRTPLDLDVRIVLTWDTDATDMDLWVTEPTGEKCYYSHALTAIGGTISRDFTGGYGPEEYLVRRALAGEYKVQANFYGSRAATLTGPTTLQATVITNFGRPDEERRALTLRLTQARDVVDVGSVRFDEPTLKQRTHD